MYTYTCMYLNLYIQYVRGRINFTEDAIVYVLIVMFVFKSTHVHVIIIAITLSP